MFATLIPLFDDDMAVGAFSLFAQKDNYLLKPNLIGTGSFDGAGHIDGLEVIESTGIDTLAADKDVFVPMNAVSLFVDIASQCSAPANRIVILLDNSVKPEEMFIKRIDELIGLGYRFAIRKLLVSDFENYREIIKRLDYIFLDYKRIDISKGKVYFSKLYPKIRLVALNIESMEVYEKLKAEGGYCLYEGAFYRLPVKKGSTGEIAPVKMTYIELLNIVNDDDYDLTKAADIIGRDTALVVSLLRMVNKMTVNNGITTIKHATAMLGQKELKKWINTAVAEKLCEDRPSEITRISLIRAKFAENLAPLFDMGGLSQELFLMGLFSVLDLILDKPMSEALNMVKVSKQIETALLKNEGDFGLVLDFIKNYEAANWSEISRLMIVENLDMDEVYNKYLDTLKWFRDLYSQD